MQNLQPLLAHEATRVGDYELLGRLGEGGQGVVYLARSSSGERVAVKMLHARFSGDPAARDRFLREVAAARRVAEFSTARVLDASTDGDRPFIVSEYVEGVSLDELVRESGPRAAGALERLAVGTMAALAAIHRAGVVHRDFKPSNVLLGLDGARVIDFGIAKALDATTASASGLIGTPAYMSPEQISGEAVGPSSDLFAWAVTMVFAATGRPAFGGDSVPAIFHRILTKEPELPGLAEPLGSLVEACLAKEPSARPTAQEALLRLVGHQPDVRPAPAGQRPPRAPATPAPLQESGPGLPATLQEPGTPATLQEPGTPATLQEPGTPATLQEPGTRATLREPGAPATLQEPGTPATLQEPGTPATLREPGAPATPPAIPATGSAMPPTLLETGQPADAQPPKEPAHPRDGASPGHETPPRGHTASPGNGSPSGAAAPPGDAAALESAAALGSAASPTGARPPGDSRQPRDASASHEARRPQAAGIIDKAREATAAIQALDDAATDPGTPSRDAKPARRRTRRQQDTAPVEPIPTALLPELGDGQAPRAKPRKRRRLRPALLLATAAIAAAFSAVVIVPSLMSNTGGGGGAPYQQQNVGQNPVYEDGGGDPPPSQPTRSKTKASVSLPALEGWHVDDAVAQLDKLGLVAKLKSVPDDGVAADYVISTSPASGRVAKGSTVVVVVSTGPEGEQSPEPSEEATADPGDQSEPTDDTTAEPQQPTPTQTTAEESPTPEPELTELKGG
ncbi:protein kinase [Nonomuraea mangrovi]|uniref:non-specific serine/threonine protein kinase n=1 Tax=Nonomuraea mangrovi TaxID=2316207 RepID=A0ABW4TG17_9ACTN